ncbi:MAG: hypothetical protein K1X88_18870, partial [Nannocystaceae bacterium]|nr:hypothetical protein [Nannocystaceae bacterium]
ERPAEPGPGPVASDADVTTAPTPVDPAPTPAEPTAPVLTPDALEADPSPTPAPTATAKAAATPSPTAAPLPDPDATELLTPNEAIAKHYGPKFRPTHNPSRFNLVARLLFANAGGESSPGGRFGGAAVDLGQSWNRFGYAATVTAWGGRYQPSQGSTTEINGLLGIGPTVGLGRLALLGRGFLDLRVGYDFYYGVLNRPGGDVVVRPSASDLALSSAKSVAPHGPRVRLDLGLTSLDTTRRFWHGIGLSMGYQALVASFGTDMPRVHMLTLGLSYWLG